MVVDVLAKIAMGLDINRTFVRVIICAILNHVKQVFPVYQVIQWWWSNETLPLISWRFPVIRVFSIMR